MTEISLLGILIEVWAVLFGVLGLPLAIAAPIYLLGFVLWAVYL
ncbi:hypothetical protein [Mycobacteroides abscessus]|nr:hypothetical protein [Mycobacteroides abscessus]